MTARDGLLRAVRWPLLVLLAAGLGILTAVILDRTEAREYALVVGAPALTVLLPVGAVWLVVALVARVRRR